MAGQAVMTIEELKRELKIGLEKKDNIYTAHVLSVLKGKGIFGGKRE